MILWSLRLSESPQLSQLEDVYFQRTSDCLQLGGEDNFQPTVQQGVEMVQAEILLATYLYSGNRKLEGQLHANAAVSIAITFGLHRTSPPRRRAGSRLDEAFGVSQQISVFWRMFILDRCWSVANGTPPIFRDVNGNVITSPWPFDLNEYDDVSDQIFDILSIWCAAAMF